MLRSIVLPRRRRLRMSGLRCSLEPELLVLAGPFELLLIARTVDAISAANQARRPRFVAFDLSPRCQGTSEL